MPNFSSALSGAPDYRGCQLGAPVTVALFGVDVIASQTNQRRAAFKAPYKLIPLSLDLENLAVAGTTSARLRNVTDNADIFASTALVSATNSRSTTIGTGQTVIEKGDVIELQATTAAASTITALTGFFTFVPADVPDNR